MSDDAKVVFGGIDRSRVRGLLFDVDGTLSDTDDHLIDRISRYFVPISWLFINKDPRPFARWFVMAVETPANLFYGFADKLGIDEPLSKLYNWLSHRRHIRKPKHDRFWIIPGVKEMLESLADHYPMAVVSARDAASTAHFLEHFDLQPYFMSVVTAQTCEFTKPYPDPVLYAAKQLGLSPGECVMIGDTIVDVHAGKSAQAQTVAVLCGFGTQSELQRAGVDLILSTTTDIAGILLNENGNDRG